MKFAGFHILGLLCALLSVKADLDSVKKNGLKILDNQTAAIKKLAEDTSLEVGNREGNIKIITKHEREFGDGIIENANFQIGKTAKSAYMMANLLGSSNEVFRCIEFREREGLAESNKFYNQKFLDPGRDYEFKAEQYQRNLIKSWKDDYYKAIDQYGKIYKQAVSDIQRATTESTVSSVVKRFEQTTNQMADIITSIFPNMNQTHIQILKILDQLVNNLQQYARYQVEETGKAIQRCFPKFFQQEAFFGHYVF